MRNTFTVTYILMVVAQMLLTNYFHFTTLCMVTILPMMVLCIPTKVETVWAMVIAFATGLAVDMFAEGAFGLKYLLQEIWIHQGVLRHNSSDGHIPDDLHRR